MGARAHAGRGWFLAGRSTQFAVPRDMAWWTRPYGIGHTGCTSVCGGACRWGYCYCLCGYGECWEGAHGSSVRLCAMARSLAQLPRHSRVVCGCPTGPPHVSDVGYTAVAGVCMTVRYAPSRGGRRLDGSVELSVDGRGLILCPGPRCEPPDASVHCNTLRRARPPMQKADAKCNLGGRRCR